MKGTFWDRVAGLYDLMEWTNGKAVRGMCAYVAERVPEGAELLECAAGTGEISLRAASRAGRVLCTDLSLPMLDRAREKAAARGLSNVSFAGRDLFHLPDPDGRYGAVCAANVLHLLPDPGPAVRELWRVTAPGGVLLLPTFLQGEAKRGFRLLIAVYRRLGFDPKHLYTRETYRDFFDSLGLPLSEFAVIPGRLPVGVAVLRKPKCSPRK